MRFDTLDGWLNWQETLHPSEIELGLDRVSQVLANLEPAQPDFTPNFVPSFKIVTVAGTNGKGSSVAMLQSILLAAGYRVGAYTSPHLLRYNERIQINGQPVDDETLCEAFERVDQARGAGPDNVSLTYFEFGTLAAIDILQRAGVQIAVLEVGLGGRLDAVNVLDPDVALITAIDIDHEAWLGSDRETIAGEKAGILRADRPAICTDPEPPQTLISYAKELGTPLYLLDRDFKAQIVENHWRWQGVKGQVLSLPMPALPGDFQVTNAAGVLAVLEQLLEQLHEGSFLHEPIDEGVIGKGLEAVRLPGRFQILPGEPVQVLDVAHNPQSARVLADNLRYQTCHGRTRAVLAMLADKDIPGVVDYLREVVDQWYLASLDVPRAASVQQLKDVLAGQNTLIFDDVVSAHQAALSEAEPQDRIVVFGSFYTVAAVLPQAV